MADASDMVISETSRLKMLKKGHTLVKLRGKKGQYPRHFQLSEDELTICYTDTKKWFGRGKDDSKWYVGDLHEVRVGPHSDVFSRQFKQLDVFTLIFGSDHDTLDLVAPSNRVAKLWVKGLQFLRKRHAGSDIILKQKLHIHNIFQKAHKSKSGELNLDEFICVLHSLNIAIEETTVKELFMSKAKISDEGAPGVDFDTFAILYDILNSREEIDKLFNKAAVTEGSYVDANKLQHFFKETQQQNVTFSKCVELIEELEHFQKMKGENALSKEGFEALFNLPVMDIFNPEHRRVHMDMTQPLAHYFIASSHNTYLMADQLVGYSSVEAYIRALKQGCRSLELDCWDGRDGEPIIYHGHTFTSQILFQDVIYAIHEYAFVTSDYPVILSIENNCSVDQQRKMAAYFKRILGEQLAQEELHEDITCLPSPMYYKRKILIKGKRLPAVDSNDSVSYEDEAAEMHDSEVQQNLEVEKLESKLELAKELSDLVVICQSVKFKGFDHAKKNHTFKQMCSITETKALDLSTTWKAAMVCHNARQFSRIYPSPLRTDSSNYDPVPMWLAGNQMVALNYQTPDQNMQINRGLFQENGGSGYILKPKFMTSFDSDPSVPVLDGLTQTLSITVISGFHLPKKESDNSSDLTSPFVEVGIQGAPEDAATQKTTTVEKNGFSPIWREKLDFKVKCPALCLVTFRVMEAAWVGNHLIAEYTLPFLAIQTGVRTVHLLDKYGEPCIESSLLVGIEITNDQ